MKPKTIEIDLGMNFFKTNKLAVKSDLNATGEISTKDTEAIKKSTRCHICCKDLLTEGYYDYHMKKYHHILNSSVTLNIKSPVANINFNYNNFRKTNVDDDSKVHINKIKDENVKIKEDERVNDQHDTIFANVPGCNDKFPRFFSCDDDYDAIDEHTYKKELFKTNAMEEHIKAIQDFDLDVRKFDCEFCMKSCLDPDHFEIHQWWRADVCKPYQCDTCSQKFHEQAQLNKHKIIHLDYKF